MKKFTFAFALVMLFATPVLAETKVIDLSNPLAQAKALVQAKAQAKVQEIVVDQTNVVVKENTVTIHQDSIMIRCDTTGVVGQNILEFLENQEIVTSYYQNSRKMVFQRKDKTYMVVYYPPCWIYGKSND